MKTSTTTPLVVAISLLAILPFIADARPRGPVGGGRGIVAPQGQQFSLQRGLSAELRTEREKFRIWRDEVRGGMKYFADSDKQTRLMFAGLNIAIAKNLVDDRISDELGRSLLNKTETVGNDALAAANRQGLTEEQDAEVRNALKQIHAILEAQATELPDPSVRTPHLNRFQLEAEELIRFGGESGTLSSGKVSTLTRKLLSLESDEQSAKSKGKLSDRDREKLFEDARKVGIDILEEFID